MRSIEKYWKTKTLAANELFNTGEYEAALAGYKDALYMAETLNNQKQECLLLAIPFMHVYIISCHNIANTYLEIGGEKESEKMIKRIVYYLIHLSEENLVEEEEIQRELKKASVLLLDFHNQNSTSQKEEPLRPNLKPKK